MGLLANDIGTFQTAYEQATGPKKAQIEQAQAFLSEFSNTLNGQTTGGGPAADKAWINTQVNARKDLAAFYVRLVSDFDEKGQPLLKSDGTPIYVPDASKVFKPEEGMKAIEEAKAKYKELYGTDLDQDPSKDPTMALLAKGIYDNSPPELQKKYKNATVAWDEAKAGIPTMIAGVGTALLMAKFKPLRPLIGESAVATWGSSLLAGSTAASVTHHTMMNNVLGRTDNSWERSIAIGTGTTIGGVALMKAPNFIFRNFGDDAAAQVIKRGGGGLMEFGAAEGGVASRLKTLDVLKAERAALSEGSATFAADKARLDGLIRANENRTGLINMLAGPKGKPIAEFDQALQALAQGGDKSKMVSDLGTPITKFGPQLKVAEEAPKFAEILGRNGGMTVPKEIAERFAAKGLPVIENAAGESVLAMRTPAEMRQVLAELPKIEPSLLGARNASQATKTANGMIAELDAMAKSGVAADANLSTVLANATLKNPEQINMLTAFVPEAKVAAQQVTSSGTNIFGAQQGLFSTAGSKMVAASGEGSGFGHRLLRGAGDKLINIGESKTLARAETFGSTVTSGKGAIALGTTAGFGSEAYNYSQTGEFNLANAGLKSALFAGGLYGAGKVGGFTRNSLVNA
ncbi:MAG TPA: hypothetical protein PK671_22720, partial [Candidatus Obscuribacter sp.]|nr:hypothetical protein [Candidatus Obscuribacter sp.]